MTYVALDGYAIFATVCTTVAFLAIAAIVGYLIHRYRRYRQ